MHMGKIGLIHLEMLHWEDFLRLYLLPTFLPPFPNELRCISSLIKHFLFPYAENFVQNQL